MEGGAAPVPEFEYAGATPMIECENIHKTYLLGVEGIPALRGITTKVFRGEFLTIFGTSGGGKTSLLNILGTIDTPTKGHLSTNGIRVSARTTDEELATLRLKTLGFVFQTFNLLPSLTARENVELPMSLLGELSKSDRRKRASELLEQVGLAERAGHYPSMLSGGEQQRVTIARSVANEPEILLLDEPTGDLDTSNTQIVMDQLLKLNREGKTLVMVTHDPNLKNFAHRALFIRDGKLWREERTDPELRRQKVRELQELVGAMASGQARNQTAAFTQEAAAGIRAVGNVASPIGYENEGVGPQTQYRRPTEYKTAQAQRQGKGELTEAKEIQRKVFNRVFATQVELGNADIMQPRPSDPIVEAPHRDVEYKTDEDTVEMREMN